MIPTICKKNIETVLAGTKGARSLAIILSILVANLTPQSELANRTYCESLGVIMLEVPLVAATENVGAVTFVEMAHICPRDSGFPKQ